MVCVHVVYVLNIAGGVGDALAYAVNLPAED
jgi:hypothetical protein